jgi:putative toxin-antitoxin system antitoxin component (TIGR02293 family)
MAKTAHEHIHGEAEFDKLAALFFGEKSRQEKQSAPQKNSKRLIPYNSIADKRIKIHHRIEKGVPVKSVQIGKVVGFTMEETAKMIGVSTKTLQRKIEKNTPLTPVEGDRLYRVVEIFSFALEVLSDFNAVKEWIESPQPALGGFLPRDLMRSAAGAEEVMNLLGRIKFGVIS